MFEIIIGVLGIVAAAIYVGYLAYAINSVPLWIIVIVTLGLALRELITEFRNSVDRDARGRPSG